MTRGTIIAIFKNKVLRSIEFNGGMGPDWYGPKVIAFLKKVKTEQDFKDQVETFNLNSHQYEIDKNDIVGEMPYRNVHRNKYTDPGFFDGCFFDAFNAMTTSDYVSLKLTDFKYVSLVDFSNGYFDGFRFFSDYLYIKNLSDNTVMAKPQSEGGIFYIYPEEIVTLNYGDFVEKTK